MGEYEVFRAMAGDGGFVLALDDGNGFQDVGDITVGEAVRVKA